MDLHLGIMVRYRRKYTTNPVFITIVASDRERWLIQPESLQAYREHFNFTLERYDWRWVAWVLLPDHLHWLIAPNDQSRTNEAYSRIVASFKAAMTGSLGKRNDGSSRWQSHFWEHTIRDERDQKAHFDYIHFNPVKHRLVAHPGAWKHSSFFEYVEKGWYPRDWSAVGDLIIPGMDKGYD